MTRLRKMVLEELQRRNYSKSTARAYIRVIRDFAAYFHRSPDKLGPEQVREFQAHLFRDRHLEPGTVVQYSAGLRFLFVKTLHRHFMVDNIPLPKEPFRLPTILSVEEVTRLIDSASNLMHRAILMTLYSTGIRRAELCQLKVSDIDKERMVIHIHAGKGQRDRDVDLSECLLDTLREYWRWMRPKTYLFPGTINNWRADVPITGKVGLGRMPRGGRPVRPEKTCLPALVAALLRHTLARSRGRSAGSPETAGPRKTRRHSQILASFAPTFPRGRQPARLSFCGDQCSTNQTLATQEEEMSRPTLEVADIIRCAGKSFIERNRSHITWQQVKVLNAIERCRTAALGGHLDQCARCGYRAISFHSCRNRHCPKCQTNARNRWLAARQRELINVRYSHVVFTVPHQLVAFALQNKKAIYTLLFESSAATLLEVAADPKHLGAEIGFLSVLPYLSLGGLRPAKPYENRIELRWQRLGAARSRLQWRS